MSYPVYPEMKASGIEWLPRVPAHWTVKRLRFACQVNPTKTEVAHLSDTMPVSFLPMERVGTEGELSLDAESELGKVFQGFTYFQNDDVIVAKITPCFENGKGALCSGLTNGIGFGSTEFHVLRPRVSYVPRFIYYLTKSSLFRDTGTALMQGAAGQKRVPEEFILNCPIASPPPVEQQFIAAFLDHKTTEIDHLIGLKEQQIELLERKRQAIISEAVTRGLNDHAPTRQTGISGLEVVPTHWKIKRLKFLLRRVEQGWSPQCENRLAEQDEWGVLKVGCVNGKKFNPDEQKALPSDVPPRPEYEIKKGDVLVSRANTRQLLGSASIVDEVRPRLLLSDKLYRLNVRQNLLNPHYLATFLGSAWVRSQFEQEATGSSDSMQNIGQDTVKELVVPLPPLTEQQMLLLALDGHSVWIDNAISPIKQQLSVLRQYRQSLISEAVTGKIDVREVVP